MNLLQKKSILTRRPPWLDRALGVGFYVFLFVYLELILQLGVFGGISLRFLYAMGFSVVAGCAVYLLSSLLPEKINRVIGFLLITAFVVYFEVQLVYHFVFGSFMPISQVSLGGAAVTNYYEQILYTISIHLPEFLALLLPVPVAAAGLFTGFIPARRLKLKELALVALAGTVSLGGTLGVLIVRDDYPASAYQMLTDVNASTEVCIKCVGLSATTWQEGIRVLFPRDTDIKLVDTTLDDIVLPTTPRPGEEMENPYSQEKYNVLDIDFEALAASTDDPALKELDEYLAGVAPSNKNEYTGMLEGYNIITICAEAFSPMAISEELTPTLYMLSNNGFVFRNFFNCFPNTTTNGEYTFCTGLLPNLSRNKITSSFNASADNYMPMCLGNALSEKGYTANAYHNYYGTFYDRYITHANMGYTFKAVSQGLEIPMYSPTSDLDMMNAVMDEFLTGPEPFHAYFMTYSGHYQYNWDNDMSAKNRELVADLPYSEEVQAYIACTLELEHALTALMEGLEEAGRADNTVIVLTADHYPYGLSDEQYSELAGYQVDTTFDKYRNAFICYVPNMEPVQVDTYCSTPDILPTLLNLLGVEYDSRLLVGRDIFSDGPHVAVLADQSFLTEDFRYATSMGTAISHAPDGSLDNNLIWDYCNYVENMFALSTKMLEADFYSHVFGKHSTVEIPQIQNFTDITNIYTESAVNFMIYHDYMLPVDQDTFGASVKGTNEELITVLHQMSGDTTYAYPMVWATETGIVTDQNVWDDTVSYGETALLMYRYVRLMTGREAAFDELEIQSILVSNPELTEEQVTAMLWAIDNEIYTGTLSMNPWSSYGKSFGRAKLARYLHQMYELSVAPPAVEEQTVQE